MFYCRVVIYNNISIVTNCARICYSEITNLLFGDLNSRTATQIDFVKCDDFIGDIYGNEDLCQENLKILHCFENNSTHGIPLERDNAYATSNAYGYQLVEVCK